MARGDEITAADFNALQNAVDDVLGDRVGGSYGYGQLVQSSQVVPGQLILKSQWDALRYDIINIGLHQTGFEPKAIESGSRTNNIITWGTADSYVNFTTLINTAKVNRFDISSGQYVISSIGSGNDSPTPTPGEYVYKSPWSTRAEAVITLNFSTPEDARYFFNSGGKIRISSTRNGGSPTRQNNVWTGLLDAIGNVDFDLKKQVNFYSLNTNYKTYFQSNVSSAYPFPSSYGYGTTFFQLAAKCNVSNNTNGGATVVNIRVRWEDLYVDQGPPAPGDVVDGTLILNLIELRAAGVLYPSGTGNFTITPPSYSISPITAT